MQTKLKQLELPLKDTDTKSDFDLEGWEPESEEVLVFESEDDGEVFEFVLEPKAN